MTGTRDIKIAKATEGRRPLTTPMMTVGIFCSQVRNETVSRYWMFEIMPTSATGIAQNTIKAVMNPTTASLRMTLCHHVIFKDFQTTSFGLTPMYLGHTATVSFES
jgi:hypothetical protein